MVQRSVESGNEFSFRNRNSTEETPTHIFELLVLLSVQIVLERERVLLPVSKHIRDLLPRLGGNPLDESCSEPSPPLHPLALALVLLPLLLARSPRRPIIILIFRF
jgi:hypothetical protein